MTFVPIPVRTLLGAKNFESSLTCLRSLADYSSEPIRFVFHDDGTLSDEQRARLAAIAGGSEFVDRTWADGVVCDLLSRYPNCSRARKTGPLFLKLFDIALLSSGPLLYADSDILFLRRYSGLFRRAADEPPLFMADVSHAYSVRPWRVWPLGSIRLAGRVNTGLIVGWNRPPDLEFLEWLLGRLAVDPSYTRRPYWVEQTCWAALAARTSSNLIEPRQAIIASESMGGYHPDVVAIHFVSTWRAKLADFESKMRPTTESAVPIRLRRARCTSAFGLLGSDLGRRL